jgi:hypothetical protein
MQWAEVGIEHNWQRWDLTKQAEAWSAEEGLSTTGRIVMKQKWWK